MGMINDLYFLAINCALGGKLQNSYTPPAFKLSPIRVWEIKSSRLSVCLSFSVLRLSVCWFVHLFVCLSLSLSLILCASSVCLSVCLSVCVLISVVYDYGLSVCVRVRVLACASLSLFLSLFHFFFSTTGSFNLRLPRNCRCLRFNFF